MSLGSNESLGSNLSHNFLALDPFTTVQSDLVVPPAQTFMVLHRKFAVVAHFLKKPA